MSASPAAAHLASTSRHERKISHSTSHSRRRRDVDYSDASHVQRIGEEPAGDGDYLAPLHARPRKSRQRVDSLSSLGSSVAPGALPGNNRYSSRYDFSDGNRQGTSNHQSSSHIAAGAIGSAEGGLEAWLKSQAVVVQPGMHGDLAALQSPQDRWPQSRGHTNPAEEARSVSGYSNDRGVVFGSRSAARNKRDKSSNWDALAVDADAAGLGSARRRAPSAQGSTRDFLGWLENADVDSQVGSEYRRRRREGGPQAAGVMSASGARIREGVRRSSNISTGWPRSGNGATPSIDALLTRSSTGKGSGLSASQSMGAAAFQSYAGHDKACEDSAKALNGQDEGQNSSHRSQRKDLASSSPLRTWCKWILADGAPARIKSSQHSSLIPSSSAAAACIILTSALVKWCTGLGGWSGKGAPPMYGDLEAQRHWIEITLHLPKHQWYFYDLEYWGLDYPPMTASISWMCGKVGEMFPSVRPHLALDSSRGSENAALILFLRASVLVLDLAIYTPAVLAFLERKLSGRGRRTRAIAASSVLLQPALILVDHGHFQYNGIMLGWSAHAFRLLYTSLPNLDLITASAQSSHDSVKSISRRISLEYILAAVFFSWSLCFKQMALYYAPAVFAIMLGRCYGLAKLGFERGLICFIGIGLATMLTFTYEFAPWLTSIEQLSQIIHRIFPLARGLFEDKVSNLWCFLSVLPLPAQYKLRNALEVTTLARLSLVFTLAAIILPCVHLFVAAAETVRIEMTLTEDSKRQVEASERRKAEGSMAGSTTTARARTRNQTAEFPSAPSDAGLSDLISILDAGQSLHDGASKSEHQTRSSLFARPVASTSPSPAAAVLPYALLSTSLAFFLFGFQTHEKSILLPLLPMTLLMSVKADEWGGGAGKADWEWAVLMNNVAMFSMWPLLRRDQVALQYIVVTVGWNWAIGYQPFVGLFDSRQSFVAMLSVAAHVAMLSVHAIELALPSLLPALASRILARYPDFFPVLTVLLSTPLFGIIWLWSLKRQLEVGFANGIDVLGMTVSAKDKSRRASRGAFAHDKKTM